MGPYIITTDEATSISLNLENKESQDMIVCMEPWGTEYPLPMGAVLVVGVKQLAEGLHLTFSPGRVTIWAEDYRIPQFESDPT